MIKSIRRAAGWALFGCGALVLWAAVVLLALEIHDGVRWRRIARSNVFVLADQGIRPWPGAPTEEPKIEEASPGALLPVRAQPNPETDFARWAARFESLDYQQQAWFDTALGQPILVLDEAGTVLRCYLPTVPFEGRDVFLSPGDSIERDLPPDTLQEVRNALSEVAIPKPGGGVVDCHDEALHRIRLRFFPGPAEDGRKGAYCFVDTSPEAPPDSPWEVPFYRYKPHVHGGQTGFTTNNFGFRGKDIVVPKPKGVFRIVCVGGSTTEEGPTNDTTYPALLEKKLRAQYGDRLQAGGRIEVVNCGISGIHSTQQRARALDYLELQPDVLLYYEAVNDITQRYFTYWSQRLRGWQKLVRASGFLRKTFNAWLLPSDAEILEWLDNGTFENLTIMNNCAKSDDVEMMVCTFAHPDASGLPPDQADYFEYYNLRFHLAWSGHYATFASYCRVVDLFNQRLTQWRASNGVPPIPVAENMHGGANYFRDICHMRPAGIERKAGIICEGLREYFEARLPKGKG